MAPSRSIHGPSHCETLPVRPLKATLWRNSTAFFSRIQVPPIRPADAFIPSKAPSRSFRDQFSILCLSPASTKCAPIPMKQGFGTSQLCAVGRVLFWRSKDGAGRSRGWLHGTEKDSTRPTAHCGNKSPSTTATAPSIYPLLSTPAPCVLLSLD
jgi:hypothetical protein